MNLPTKMFVPVCLHLGLLTSFVTRSEANDHDHFDNCEGLAPFGYYCGYNEVNTTYVPCSKLCDVTDDGTFTPTCIKLCNDFIEKYGSDLRNRKETATNTNVNCTTGPQVMKAQEQPNNPSKVVVGTLIGAVCFLCVVIVGFIVTVVILLRKNRGSNSRSAANKKPPDIELSENGRENRPHEFNPDAVESTTLLNKSGDKGPDATAPVELLADKGLKPGKVPTGLDNGTAPSEAPSTCTEMRSMHGVFNDFTPTIHSMQTPTARDKHSDNLGGIQETGEADTKPHQN